MWLSAFLSLIISVKIQDSTVGSVIERVKREMEKDKNISKRVKNLKDILGKS